MEQVIEQPNVLEKPNLAKIEPKDGETSITFAYAGSRQSEVWDNG